MARSATTAGDLDASAPPAAAPAMFLDVPASALWIGGTAIVLAYLGFLAHFPLSEPDEARYAEIAREMLRLHDWITPHLNYVKYFEKPPLVYWLTAINFKLFGISELVARLWPALLGLLGIWMTYVVGRSMYGRWTGAVAAALLAATPFYFGLSQFLVLDMPLSTLLTVGMAAFWVAYRDAGQRRPFVGLLYVAVALAVLIKGPVAVVLTGGIVLLFLWLERDLAALRWALSPPAIGLFLIIALPWFIIVTHRNPEFLDFFIIKQHVDRFLLPDEHREPFWFFIPIVLGGMLPWTAFILLAPRLAARFVKQVARRRVSVATVYCLVWSGIIFVFFSASGSKLATYVLPMFPPFAILAARFFHRLIAHRMKAVFIRTCTAALIFSGLIIVGGAVAGVVSDYWRVPLIVPHVYAGGLALGVAAAAALVLARRQALPKAFAVLLAGMLVVQIIAITDRSVGAQYRSLGLAVAHLAGPHDDIIEYRHYTQGVPFYARRRVIMVGSWGELDFGRRQGDQRRFFWPQDAQLLAIWHSPQHVFLVINRSELEPLRARMQPPPRQVAACGTKVVVVNFKAHDQSH